MEPVADKIVRLETELQALEDREKAGEKGLSDRIAAKEKRLNIYLESQKGKFDSPISVVLSYSYRSHIFAHSLSTSPLHPSRFGKYAR
jgi:hypothetical protein